MRPMWIEKILYLKMGRGNTTHDAEEYFNVLELGAHASVPTEFGGMDVHSDELAGMSYR